MNDLLKIFWESHNPTQHNRQGNDIGTQYRSIILADKKDLISNLEKSKEKFQKILTSKSLGAIHTEIRILENFFVAEDYHQKYLHKNPNGYCGLKGLEVNYL
jgi:peptide-methionine (S)-S-oxide reductase